MRCGLQVRSTRETQDSLVVKEESVLTTQENQALTSVMPGTPMGELFRRYWHPIGAAAELDDLSLIHI